MRLILSFLISLLISTIAQADTLRHTIPANKTSTVGARAIYGPSCKAGAIPKLRLAKEPKHGSVSFRQASWKLGEKSGRCAGQPVKGTLVIYKPDRGYRGKDDFKIAFTMDMHTYGSAKIRNVVDKYVIEVK